MVAPSQFQVSASNSLGSRSRNMHSARKRREFPRNLDSRRHKTNSALNSSSSMGSASKSRTSDKPLTRPPQSPSSKLHFANGVKPQSTAVQEASAQGVTSQKTKPCSPLKLGGVASKTFSGGKPPIAAGPSSVSSSNSSMFAKTMLQARASIARSSSVLPKHKNHSPYSSLEQRQDDSSLTRQTFYVRVCLGHLTGVIVDSVKRRRNTSNNIVVAYAVLAKSGKRLALSQPLGPAIEDGSQMPLKLFWTNPRGVDSISPKHSKRKLQFSLKLEREMDRDHQAEENSLPSQNVDFIPEVVKVIIGLKCGEEKYPLGIANIVINGKPSMGQNVDLALRSMNEISSSEMMEYQQKARVGFFGKRLQVISFKNHHQQYRLASNATLSVRMDVKPGSPGRSGTLWGDEDEASYATNFTFDTLCTKTSPGLSSEIQHTSSTIAYGGSSPPNQAGRHATRNFESLSNQNTEKSNPSKSGSRDKFPLRFVVVDDEARKETISITSSLTLPSPGLCSWFCLPSWGGEIEPAYRQEGDLNNTASLSFEDELPSWNEIMEVQNVSRREESAPLRSREDEPTHSERSDRSAESLGSARNDFALRPGSRYSAPKREVVHAKLSGEYEERESFCDGADMSVGMYDDLKDAEATLLRYAKRVGVDMADLLDDVNTDVPSLD